LPEPRTVSFMSWSVVAPERTPVHGGRDYPSVRYSAAAVEYRGEIIITHGYFYNHAIRHPAWQSSAWAFNFGTKRWREIHGGEKEGAPSARYSCTAVLYDNALWMFGGDDGGHKHSMFNYVFQAWFNQMWRFDLRTYSWQQVRPNGAPPVKRALHSAVTIGNSMYLYGGLELADTWRYDFASASWTLLVPPPADTDTKDGSHPGRRHAFAAAANTGGFYIFGGCRHVRGSRPLAFSDTWYYSIADNAWRLVQPATDPTTGTRLPLPPARSHHSMVPLTDKLLLLYGGALCIPGCSCYGDSWLFDTTTQSWSSLNASDAPIHRYRQNVVVHGREGAIYLYGGESYQPYMYHNAVNRMELPSPIKEQMIAYATPPAGAKGGGGVKRGGGMGHRSRKTLSYSGGRAAAETEEQSTLTAVVDAVTTAAANGKSASRNLSGGTLALLVPAGALVVGLAVWGIATRRQRSRYGKYKPVDGS